MIEFEDLLALWKPHENMAGLPPEPIRLWGSGGCGIWLSETWGPAVPYPPVDHRNGNFNHGYIRSKGRSGEVAAIPEVQGWPELQRILDIVNATESPIESVGCEKSFFPMSEEGSPRLKLGSYIDVVFSEAALNDRPR